MDRQTAAGQVSKAEMCQELDTALGMWFVLCGCSCFVEVQPEMFLRGLIITCLKSFRIVIFLLFYVKITSAPVLPSAHIGCSCSVLIMYELWERERGLPFFFHCRL